MSNRATDREATDAWQTIAWMVWLVIFLGTGFALGYRAAVVDAHALAVARRQQDVRP